VSRPCSALPERVAPTPRLDALCVLGMTVGSVLLVLSFAGPQALSVPAIAVRLPSLLWGTR